MTPEHEIATLKADLELHRGKVAELERLLEKQLRNFAILKESFRLLEVTYVMHKALPFIACAAGVLVGYIGGKIT